MRGYILQWHLAQKEAISSHANVVMLGCWDHDNCVLLTVQLCHTKGCWSPLFVGMWQCQWQFLVWYSSRPNLLRLWMWSRVTRKSVALVHTWDCFWISNNINVCVCVFVCVAMQLWYWSFAALASNWGVVLLGSVLNAACLFGEWGCMFVVVREGLGLEIA